MKRIRIGLACALLAGCGLLGTAQGQARKDMHPAPSADLQVWITTPDLKRHLSPEFHIEHAQLETPTIQVDTSERLQEIDGFGAAFTDTSAWLLHGLPKSKQHLVMEELFGRSGKGIGLSLMRVPMGSSDFTRTGTYSYADAKQSEDLPQFSTRHDDDYIIPVLREAEAVNPEMKLFANPWSPPAWMKTNGSMLGTWKHSTLIEGEYGSFANYFVKFLQEYAAKGVRVWGITPQNEPNQDPSSYSGMYLSAENEARFITQDLVPALHKAGLYPAILAGDTSDADPKYAQGLLQGGFLLPQIAATAWHCYQGMDAFGRGLREVRHLIPERPLYVTECSTGEGGHIAGDATEKTLAAINNGASGMVLWNLALDPHGGPKMGVGCEQCTGLLTIDPINATYAYTLNFYELGQFSSFVHAGAHRIQSADGDGIRAQAFENQDHSLVVVAYNTEAKEKSVSIRIDSGPSTVILLPPYATATLVQIRPRHS